MAGSGSNNLMKNVVGSTSSVVPTGFGNSGVQVGHSEMSEPQAQALAQSQYVQAQVQAHARAAHARFQAQLAQSQKQGLMGGGSGNVNTGVSSPSVVTPANAKRSGQKPSSRPPSSAGGAAGSPLKTMELAPVARRRKRAPPEKQIPEKVAAFLPESALYTQLLDFEGRIDAALARKKVDIQESVKNPTRVQRTLRIYVYNTFANQTQTGDRNENNEPPSWSLKIIGRILQNGSDSDSTLVLRNPTTSPKFSSFFKKITIYLDQNQYPENHVILWESSRALTLNEGFEVKRKGDKEFTAIIRFEMNYVPEKFKLSPLLSEILGLEIETRSRIIFAIWQYVKVKKLQISTDTSYFTCDPPLRKLFGEEKVKFSMVSQKISQHLSPPPPIHLEHKIKLSGDNPIGNTCYDVLVDLPISLDKDMSTFLENLEKHREIDACDEAICSAIKKIHEHRRRRAFFLGFSQSPGEFIDGFVESQSMDLKTAAGDATRNAEKEQRAEFYNQPWVEDAVIRYLNRKPTAGSDARGST
ncbi:putative transcription regulator SWI/SNF-BAF60b family [Helianthus annuus]|uniref:Putative actin-dependent regulator of chromatin n=1 Tax=Helianthus annuus TaxID=4232 RepID=A0A251VE24_HELAN|nr:SWI/SNF complex component SNF12 homolog [Helianthus annuus]XP_022012176.1 SWI/SNF complex component SNF12 homolog [Helianthus annuus]KAF5817213.1 putative transcription regulator SWI/SNF-BAF60b family [Helianthus annuus]KAJ0613874.1 putative transcription regulator SWI/SNF-BAF60b family [Helianthus annuus]KAJ0954336.1 putative transcription regulator SWI/SNF-BAF60b family [Helianthus annuus]